MAVARAVAPLLGAYVLFEPAHFIMERKMMLGIKSRAESLRMVRPTFNISR